MRFAPEAIALGAALASFAACSSSEERTGSSSSAACGTDPALTWENFGGPFVLSWCTGCHSSELAESRRKDAPLGVDFDTLEGIREHEALIELRAVEKREMPPAGGPHDEDRERLAEWLACGAPAEGDGFNPPDAPDASPPLEPSGSCAEKREHLPMSALPRCSPETWACVSRCPLDHPDDEDGTDACRDACIDADLTPPDPVSGLGCADCGTFELIACAWDVGCRDQVAAFMCCIEGCTTATCYEEECGPELAAFGQCTTYRGESCFSLESGALGVCHDKSAPGPADAGADSPGCAESR